MVDWLNGVSPTFYTDKKVRRWQEDTRSLALYLLTGPQASPEGFYHVNRPTMADDLQWTAERTTAALDELTRTRFCLYDDDSRAVFIVKGLKHSLPITKPRAISKALSNLDRVHASDALFNRFLAAAEQYQSAFAEAISSHYGRLERDQTIRQRREAGESPSALATEFGMTVRRVQQICA